jgi:two-component system phosphate regulon sensor histidine kinase PhoR
MNKFTAQQESSELFRPGGLSLFSKIYGSYALLVLFTVLIIGVVLIFQIGRDMASELERTLYTKVTYLREPAAELLQTGLMEMPREKMFSLRNSISQLSDAGDAHISIIDASGEVLVDSHGYADSKQNQYNAAEIQEARRKGEGRSVRHNAVLENSSMYYAIAVTGEDDSVLGFIRAAMDQTELSRRLHRINAIIFVGILITLVASFILGFFLSRGITQRINHVKEVAVQIALGEYQERVPITQRDEISQMAYAFNTMAQTLEDRIQAISANRNQLEAVMSSMDEGVIAIDGNEHVLLLNRIAEQLFGVSEQYCLGRKVYECIRVVSLLEALELALKEGKHTEEQLVLVETNQDRMIDLRVSPLEGDSGGIEGAVAVLHDVTRIRRLEMLRRDFVANASHELKSPIAAIRGLVETMIDDGEMEPGIRQRFLTKVKDETLRLGRLVGDMLALSRVEAKDENLDFASISLITPVRSAVEAQRALADQKRIALSLDLPATPPQVVGDDDALSDMAGNLLNNALKYTTEGGSVWVRVFRDGDKAVLEIADNGIGIPEAHLDRIFERFYRVDKARSRQLGGTGLGLAIVKHIVLAHDGEIKVTSKLGAGTTFRVELPVATGSEHR